MRVGVRLGTPIRVRSRAGTRILADRIVPEEYQVAVLTALDADSLYTPPSLGSGGWSTEYRYDLARRLTQIRRPHSVTIGFAYAWQRSEIRTP